MSQIIGDVFLRYKHAKSTRYIRSYTAEILEVFNQKGVAKDGYFASGWRFPPV